MPRGDWSILAAVAGLAALFVAFGSGLYLASLNNPQDQRYQPYRHTAEQPKQIEATAAAKASAQPLQYRTPCDQPEGQGESDLCAQWKAANGAQDGAFWTKLGVWVGIIGSSLLLWQIILTRKAVEDTSEATEAMRGANQIAANSQRPWISISAELLDFKVPTEHAITMDFTVTFKNTGKMVAENFYGFAKCVDTSEVIMPIVRQWFDKFEIEEAMQFRDTAIIPGGDYDFHGMNGRAIEGLPWMQKEGYRKDCSLLLIAMCRYRIPGEKQWRFAMQSFTIGEKVTTLDRFKVVYDSIRALRMERIVVSAMGGSRAT